MKGQEAEAGRSRRADEAFTLIELLVVMLILGILAAIAIPTYLSFRQNAQNAAVKSDLRYAIDAVESCRADNGIYPLQYGGPVNLANLITPSGSPPYACTGSYHTSKNSLVGYRSDVAGANYVVYALSLNGASKAFYCYSTVTSGSITQAPQGYSPSAALSC